MKILRKPMPRFRFNHFYDPRNKCCRVQGRTQDWRQCLKDSAVGVEEFGFSCGFRFSLVCALFWKCGVNVGKSSSLGTYCRISRFGHSAKSFWYGNMSRQNKRPNLSGHWLSADVPRDRWHRRLLRFNPLLKNRFRSHSRTATGF